uniref:Uncharacterized protein n=2 Tax=unclassified Rosemountvirus TaxID=2738372 RepID=A0AAU8GJY3_9CAUD
MAEKLFTHLKYLGPDNFDKGRHWIDVGGGEYSIKVVDGKVIDCSFKIGSKLQEDMLDFLIHEGKI